MKTTFRRSLESVKRRDMFALVKALWSLGSSVSSLLRATVVKRVHLSLAYDLWVRSARTPRCSSPVLRSTCCRNGRRSTLVLL